MLIRITYLTLKNVFLLFVSLTFFLSNAQAQIDFNALNQITEGDSLVASINIARKEISKNKVYHLLPELTQQLKRIDTMVVNDILNYRKALARIAHQWYASGSLLQAKVLYEKANALLPRDELMNDFWVFYIENPLAVIYTQLGDYEKATVLYKFSIEVLNRIGEDKKAIRTLNNLAIVYQSIDDDEKAKQSFIRSMELSKQIAFDDGLIKAQLGIVTPLLRLTQYELAKKYIDFTEVEPPSDLYLFNKHLNNKVDYYEALSDYNRALNYSDESIDLLDSIYSTDNNREIAKYYYKRANLLYKKEDYGLATAEILKGVQTLVSSTSEILLIDSLLYPENSFAELYELYGDVMQSQFIRSGDQSDLVISIAAYSKSVFVFDLLREDYLLNGSKFLSAKYATQIRNKAFDAIGLLADENEAVKWSKKVISLTKNTILNDQLLQTQKETYLTNSENQELIKTKTELREVQISGAGTQQQIDLVNKVNDLLRKVDVVAIDYYSGKYVEYVISDNYVFALHNFEGLEKLQKLGKSSYVIKLINEYSQQMQAPKNRTQLEVTLSNLYDELLNPLSSLPYNFAVIPDGDIALVSFELLRHDDRYLIEDHMVDYRLSTMIVESNDIGEGIAIVCPNYGFVGDRVSVDRSAIYPLKYAANESRAVADLYGIGVIDKEYDYEDIQQVFETNKIFHFSGHARPSQNGSLILAGTKGEATRTVTGSELSLINSKLSLAVLSACETGVGDQQKGEAMLSLTRSLVQGGTPNIVNSLWAVNDQTTAKIMTDFHQGISSGKNVNVSLRQSKLNYLESHDGEELHPYYWGGFIHTTAAIYSGSSRSHVMYYALGAMALVFFIFKIKS